MSVETCFVEVVAYAGDEVVNRLGPMSESKAERVDRGMSINLDHETFYTRIVTEPAA